MIQRWVDTYDGMEKCHYGEYVLYTDHALIEKYKDEPND